MLIILLAYVYYFWDLQTLEKNYCRTFVKDCEGNLKTINVNLKKKESRIS